MKPRWSVPVFTGAVWNETSGLEMLQTHQKDGRVKREGFKGVGGKKTMKMKVKEGLHVIEGKRESV